MKKKLIIAVSIFFSTIILVWTTFIILFPVLVIEGEEYNKNKIAKLSKQRELVYNELYNSLNNEINKIIDNQYNILLIDNKNIITNEIENTIIYNGDISLFDKINEFNFLNLKNEELRILRNTIYAKYGYIFQSNDLSEHFNRFIWYNPQYNNVDEKLTEYDWFIIEIIRKIENQQINNDIQGILEIFYTKTINLENTFFQSMAECINSISFPLQKKTTYLINEIFPVYINIIKYNNQYFDEFILNLLIGLYENIIINIIETKTRDFIEYIDHFSYDHENITTDENFFDQYINQCIISNKIIDKINWSNINLLDVSYINIPVIEIDYDYYSLVAINELQKSMRIVSPKLIKNTKDILIEGINYQTEIYSNNIIDYVDWYYSYLTSIDKTVTNIIGFFTGKKSVEEKYYIENFNRIMNKNVNFDNIIKDELYYQIDIILNIYYKYLEMKDYFTVSFNQNTSDFITGSDFVEPYIDKIMTYFEQVFEVLENADNYYLQEFTINDNAVVKTAKTSIKLLADVTFFGGIFVDYLSLKTQELLNRSELEQKIFDSMMQNQQNKIAIINDPFNYLFDKLSIGSVLFVENYFAGFNTYQHYGVYIGNGNVIHFAPHEGQEINMENGIIHETTLEKFLNGRSLKIDINIKPLFSENEIVQRARSRLGDKDYNLLLNNCEHFARWCVTGEHISYQVINSPEKIGDTISIIQENYNMVSKFFELFN